MRKDMTRTPPPPSFRETPGRAASPEPKTCWVVSDGRAGIENQALGLAEAVGLPITLKRVDPRPPWRWLPAAAWPAVVRGADPLAHFARPGDEFIPPWPDLLIATGRLAIPYSLAVRRLSRGRTLTVQTQNPRLHCACFDLVVPPAHDLLAGPNVIPILGAPHRVTAAKLKTEAERVAPLLAHLPRPLVTVLIGGHSKHYRLTPERLDEIIEDLCALTRHAGAGLAVTASRRTGEANLKRLIEGLKDVPAFVWDGQGHNPYFGMLGLADHILVTADSTNMVTEATATGKPVQILDLPGGAAKFRRFHRNMQEYGATRPFRGRLESWRYPPLNETARVARHIRALLGLD